VGKHYKGFTLLELLVVIAILGITMAFAVPGLSTMVANNRLSSGANDLVAAMQLAKTEAVARVNPATLCKSNDGAGCAGGGDWQQGWIVFSDINGDAAVNGLDQVLLVHEPLDPRITFGGTPGVANSITYRATGTTTINNTEVLTVCDARGFIDQSRGILVTITGRGSVMKASDTGQNACL
jgi:type IV fimbrial biogenesis protein FimT